MDNNKSGNRHTKNVHKKNFGSLLSYLRSWDQFGQPVGLTIDGESEFKTLYGSAASIGLAAYMLYILVLAYTPVLTREIETAFTSISRYNSNEYGQFEEDGDYKSEL
jgi:hypothetical protein